MRFLRSNCTSGIVAHNVIPRCETAYSLCPLPLFVVINMVLIRCITQFLNYSMSNFTSPPHKIGRWVLVDILMLNQNMKKNKCENRTSLEIFEKNPFIQAVQRNFINKILKFYKSSVALNHYFEW